jgi:DNA-binding LacI/PurR family transcriptional regulator
MPDRPGNERHSVTTREIAARAGVSNATVSLALRHHPRISAATRDRVLRMADELGYRPDPQIAKLMFRLRSQRAPGFQSTIAALTTTAEGYDLPYLAGIRESAKARAETLGYAFTLVRVPDSATQKASLQRMLVSRGIEGLLLLPLAVPRSVVDWLDWSHFSVVAATYGVLAPQFHRVVPHQFGNTLQLCEELAKLGYRRIGLVTTSEHDLVVHHGFSAAVAWQSLLGGTELVRPLVGAGQLPTEGELRPWFRRERPDVILAAGEGDTRRIARILGLAIPGPIGFAVTDRQPDSLVAGIDERPEEIGAAAIDLLHTKIVSGNVGIPRVPTVAMVPGEWVCGASVACRAGVQING